MAGPDWQAVKNEVTHLLQELIRLDTTNPPGNETVAAEYVADVLSSEGIEAQVLEGYPGRGNVLAELPGSTDEPPLILLSHLDVVPTEAEEWEHPPSRVSSLRAISGAGERWIPRTSPPRR